MKYTIEQARILSGLTQVEVSEMLGMTEKTYIQYEKYRRIFRVDIALNFVEITEIPMDSIIFFDSKLQKNCTWVRRKKHGAKYKRKNKKWNC